jgi:hypothetical protein
MDFDRRGALRVLDRRLFQVLAADRQESAPRKKRGNDFEVNQNKTKLDRILFLSAIGILLIAFIVGLVGQTYKPQGEMTYVNSHGITTERVGGGPFWFVFERGLIFGDASVIGDGPSSPMRRIFGDNVKWVDLSNPPPFILAALLAALGLIVRIVGSKSQKG